MQSNERSLDLGYLDHCLRTVLSLTEYSSTQREELLNSPEKVAQVLVDVTLATTQIALTHDIHLLEGAVGTLLSYELWLMYDFSVMVFPTCRANPCSAWNRISTVGHRGHGM